MKINCLQIQPFTSSRNLVRRAFAFALVAAICVLTTPVTTGQQNPTRPIKVTNSHGTILITVDPLTGDYELIDSGVASHLGRFTNSGSGVLNLETGIFLSGTGVLVAANGDTISWIVAGGINTVTYVSGTGRFEGVTGLFPVTITSQTLLSENEDGTVTFLMTYEGEGVISY
ncbi:MAG TPA: hypothetical protein VF773_04200 [Verrucomicrobiae bacterium]